MSPLEAIAYLRADAPASAAPWAELDDDEHPVLTPFADGLLVSYALDCGDDLELVQRGDLDDAEISAAALHSAALANLAALVKGKLVLRRSGNLCVLALDGNFEASLVLLDALWDRNLRDCYQQPVIAVPSRDQLAFCDVGSQAGLRELRLLASRVTTGDDESISSRLYTRVEGKWSVHLDPLL